MIHVLMIAALAAAQPAESQLAEQLPGIFARAAEHYKALDAAATPQMNAGAKGPRVPHGFKRSEKKLDMRSIYWWTTGHYAGSLWYLYEATGEDFFKNRATVWTELLAPNSKVTDNHDVGFIMYCSFGNARRILATKKYDALLMETANSLSQRFNPNLGLIRSWGALDAKKDFLVIPDNLMNLELLEWAAGQPKGERFDAIARSHADVTMKHHFRPDGGCFHVLDYDQETGRVMEHRRGQGASVETAWSRGESWAIYGYTMMYRETGYVRYLDFAKKLADWAITNPNMPEDGIPYWDYGAPGEERDSSAGAIMASALVELSQYVGEADRARYRAFAVKELTALASPAYFSTGDEIGHFLLKHGVGHKPGKSEVDTPLDYGDYYFLEGLLRFKALLKVESGLKKIAADLPANAVLPKDEFAARVRPIDRKAVDEAEKIVNAPIPDTADDLYLEYWSTGNRTHYQNRRSQRLHNLETLVAAEAFENKGRFVARIEDYLKAICEMKSWLLPAHDSGGVKQGTFRGVWITSDLVSSGLAATLACDLQVVGAKLSPALVQRVKTEIERRCFAPVRREVYRRYFPGTAADSVRVRGLWWLDCQSNWSAVCWDGTLCGALGLLNDPIDRALFVDAAIQASEIYVKDAFAEDGYCSEGMGYWNYGYGHHLLTGRLLDEITNGKINFFNRPKQRLISAYPRAYTLQPGVSPAFADGNGAVSPDCLKIVDKYWPELPKELPPYSEFPDGQVWLFRDPSGISAAFKGGHNAELHNHNDLGSYYVLDGDRVIAGDPGGEVYTARTFSAHRYDSAVLNSYGHPVPVVGGKLQSSGRRFAAKILSRQIGPQVATVVLDLTKGYEVPTLKSLTRTFTYDRAAKTFSVRDQAAFTAPTLFEDCYVTTQKGAPKVAVNVREGELVAQGEETLQNPGRPTPRRFAWKSSQPLEKADIEFVFKSAK